MANEIFIPAAFDAGDVVYVVEYDSTGQAWNTDTLTWETHSSLQADYVGHRATIGANRNYGPYNSQLLTESWVAFVTTQSAGNESLSLDESVFDEQIGWTTEDRTDLQAALAAAEAVQGYLPATGPLASAPQIDGLDATAQLLRDTIGIPQQTIADDIQTAGAGNRPVNQAVVPPSRTWKLKSNGSDGLVGETQLTVKASGIPKLFAIDFAADLSNNGRVSDITAVSVIAGNPANITLGSDLSNVSDYGVDRSQVKVRITPTAPGTYRIRVSAAYDPADGGGGNEADVTLIVKA